MASVPITVLLYNGLLLCGFHAPIGVHVNWPKSNVMYYAGLLSRRGRDSRMTSLRHVSKSNFGVASCNLDFYLTPKFARCNKVGVVVFKISWSQVDLFGLL